MLESQDILLQGRWERSSFSAEDLMNDAIMLGRTSNLKNTLDHFEKWIGIVKVDARFHSDKNCCPVDQEMSEGRCPNYVTCFCIFTANLYSLA